MDITKTLFFVMLVLATVLLIRLQDATTNDTDYIARADEYIYRDTYCVGSTCIHENMTWAQIRQKYTYAKSYPYFENAATAVLADICGG